ncbi:MAG: SRPBCC family protein [Anaerolineae bacterium]|nr:SRPBCC family protein [Anaerolineae bacterium]
MSEPERILSLVGGGVISVAAFVLTASRRRLVGFGLALLGGELTRMGITGNSRLYDAVGVNRAVLGTSRQVSVPHQQGYKIEEAVLIRRSPEELYNFWRNVTNLPRIMSHLESVTVLNGRRSHWVAKAPAGARVEWDAEIINEVPNERIGWRSLEGSQIDNAGSVTFKGTPDNQTLVEVTLKYDPPAGAIGAAIAKLLGEEPEHQVREDLKHFRERIESGEISLISSTSPI